MFMRRCAPLNRFKHDHWPLPCIRKCWSFNDKFKKKLVNSLHKTTNNERHILRADNRLLRRKSSVSDKQFK